MCLPEKSKFCFVCMVFYLLSWTPAQSHSDLHHGNHSNTYHVGHTKNHSHSHDSHDDHEIPKVTLDNLELYDKQRSDEEQNYFLGVLFDKYSTNGSLKLDALFLMLNNLGLNHESKNNPAQGHDDHEGHNHEGHNHEGHDHGDHDHDHAHDDLDLFEKKKDQDHPEGHEHDYKEKKCNLDHGSSESREIIRGLQDHIHHSMCVSSPSDLLSLYHYNATKGLAPSMLLSICPALLTMIDRSLCQSKNSSHTSKSQDDHDHDHHHGDEAAKERLVGIEGEIWGFSCASVVIISLVGLLGVAVIPIMQKVFYNHLLQFLVALAVGALSGDALLHLIPHAFGGGSHSHHDHAKGETGDSTDGVLKGLCGLSGIYVFFMMERLLTIYTESKKRKKRKSRLGRRTSSGVTGISMLNSPGTDHDCETAMLGIHPGARALDNFAKESEKHLSTLREKEEESCAINNHGSGNENDEAEAVLQSHHGHSHHHHKKMPTTVASIAWMVILGDGIHNLSDGLAIGAAYSNSITGGISTSIAVFCHELPHEIGDFAVLLRAGMTVRQALVYNCVSSVLAFIGMVIGVLIGNVGSASLWIFAMIGGMFLYIALVDMMPEMTALDTKKGENLFCHLMLQSCGMVLGAGIMFLIAIFEHDLMTFLEP
ncbi:hypothetical protein FSP39_020518 [Pinctada imbricata]|uniref:Zinc transporter ZIP10 n=1 Tax=Pinctada imbricata TaxID=66713 RepID=A0AA89C544_PINIB|nr:hypothetical protein FSP39_020518 [Pinctada imbricata]